MTSHADNLYPQSDTLRMALYFCGFHPQKPINPMYLGEKLECPKSRDILQNTGPILLKTTKFIKKTRVFEKLMAQRSLRHNGKM